jgi:hypothetical protein
MLGMLNHSSIEVDITQVKPGEERLKLMLCLRSEGDDAKQVNQGKETEAMLALDNAKMDLESTEL